MQIDLKEILEVEQSVQEKMSLLNNFGIPVIFCITGNFSSGKTYYAKELIKKFSFSHIVNIGVITKTLNYLQNNLNDKTKTTTIQEIITKITESYSQNGVNAIIEGVQIDTEFQSKNKNILGGVILKIDKEIAKQRGNKPDTHFKRLLSDIEDYPYKETDTFLSIENIESQKSVIHKILNHLDLLLDEKIRFCKKNIK